MVSIGVTNVPGISLPFHHGEIHAEVPIVVSEVLPKPALNFTREEQLNIVTMALKNPIGCPSLREMVKGKERVAIVVSDISRLAPTSLFLPKLLEDIRRGGICPQNITIVIGTGNHRPVTQAEKLKLVGSKVLANYRCKDSREGKYIRMGITSRGTPVEVSEYVAEADFKIFTGNIELHRLAGFSGGVKAAIGISSPQAIEQNHRISHLGPFQPGELADNPVRKDLEEYAKILKADFLFNVVTDERGNIEAAFSGDTVKAHRVGALYAKEKYYHPLSEPAKLVILSAGGAPKDDSLYQALKAIQNGMEVLEPGGILVAVASCREGFGDDIFEEWATGLSSQQALSRGNKEFLLGGHKAVALAGILQKGNIFLVSDLDSNVVRKTGMVPFDSLQSAVDKAISKTGTAEALVIPSGGVTVPYLVRKQVLAES